MWSYSGNFKKVIFKKTDLTESSFKRMRYLRRGFYRLHHQRCIIQSK
ncbi:hypothetical protein BH10CYA1_BH10CYA1_25470 [soil metagenome]